MRLTSLATYVSVFVVIWVVILVGIRAQSVVTDPSVHVLFTIDMTDTYRNIKQLQDSPVKRQLSGSGKCRPDRVLGNSVSSASLLAFISGSSDSLSETAERLLFFDNVSPLEFLLIKQSEREGFLVASGDVFGVPRDSFGDLAALLEGYFEYLASSVPSKIHSCIGFNPLNATNLYKEFDVVKNVPNESIVFSMPNDPRYQLFAGKRLFDGVETSRLDGLSSLPLISKPSVTLKNSGVTLTYQLVFACLSAVMIFLGLKVIRDLFNREKL